MKRHSNGTVDFIAEPVDAMAVPVSLPRFRNMFASFHHFRPDAARSILRRALEQQRPIGIFELTERSVLGLFGSLVLPIFVLLVTPFIRPFRWSRLVWTYLLPIVPLMVIWDGFVSCLRTYLAKELQDMVVGVGVSDYVWEIGRACSRTAPAVTHLIGYPRKLPG
jgi:hypothetical protein